MFGAVDERHLKLAGACQAFELGVQVPTADRPRSVAGQAEDQQIESEPKHAGAKKRQRCDDDPELLHDVLTPSSSSC